MAQVRRQGKDAVDEIREKYPHVFMVIARKLNGNVMCYSYDGKVVKAFWLNLDPGYTHCPKEEPMRYIDYPGYNFSTEPARNGVWVTINSVPKKPMRVTLTPKGNAVAHLSVNSEDVLVHYIWVESRDSWVNLTPHFIDIHGINRKHKAVTERMYP